MCSNKIGEAITNKPYFTRYISILMDTCNQWLLWNINILYHTIDSASVVSIYNAPLVNIPYYNHCPSMFRAQYLPCLLIGLHSLNHSYHEENIQAGKPFKDTAGICCKMLLLYAYCRPKFEHRIEIFMIVGCTDSC